MTFPRPHETPAPAVEEEKEYKIKVYLINGDVFDVYGTVSASDLIKVYESMGQAEGRMQFPTAPDVMHFLPTSSLLRLEATGDFEQE